MEHVSAYNLRISGRVQGVGFRYATLRKAQRYGVAGWVRNMADGSVEVECEGESGEIDRFIRFLSKGPPGSHVRSVDKRIITPKGYTRFTVEF